MHLKYLRGFYKYHLCSKKNSEELLWSALCTWHQNDLLSSPCYTDAVTSRICSCPDGELVQVLTRQCDTHSWAQGRALGTRRLRYSQCQEGGGGESLSQYELLSLNLWQDTRHFSKGKFIKPWTGEGGKGGSDQRAGDHAMCQLSCSLVFSKIQCYYAGLCVCVLQYT